MNHLQTRQRTEIHTAQNFFALKFHIQMLPNLFLKKIIELFKICMKYDPIKSNSINLIIAHLTPLCYMKKKATGCLLPF